MVTYRLMKILEAVCTSAKSFVLLWPSTVFICQCPSLLSLPCLRSPLCDCSADARLNKMSFLFQCIILPFDLDTLSRMSNNVKSAKSVLFSKACKVLEKCYRFHV